MNEHSRVTVGRPAKHKSCRRGCYTHKLTPSRTHARTHGRTLRARISSYVACLKLRTDEIDHFTS